MIVDLVFQQTLALVLMLFALQNGGLEMAGVSFSLQFSLWNISSSK